MHITWLQRWCNMISSVTRCKPRVCLFSLQISSQTNFNKARWQICKTELNSEQCCRFIRTHPACARTDTRMRRDRKWIGETALGFACWNKVHFPTDDGCSCPAMRLAGQTHINATPCCSRQPRPLRIDFRPRHRTPLYHQRWFMARQKMSCGPNDLLLSRADVQIDARRSSWQLLSDLKKGRATVDDASKPNFKDIMLGRHRQ